MLKFINNYFFIPTAIVVGSLVVGFVDSNGDDVNGNEVSVETEELNRSPFSTPKGIRSISETFKKGEVAENVIGIFNSKKFLMDWR